MRVVPAVVKLQPDFFLMPFFHSKFDAHQHALRGERVGGGEGLVSPLADGRERCAIEQRAVAALFDSRIDDVARRRRELG